MSKCDRCGKEVTKGVPVVSNEPNEQDEHFLCYDCVKEDLMLGNEWPYSSRAWDLWVSI